jgi:hypothetical protein
LTYEGALRRKVRSNLRSGGELWRKAQSLIAATNEEESGFAFTVTNFRMSLTHGSQTHGSVPAMRKPSLS